MDKLLQYTAFQYTHCLLFQRFQSRENPKKKNGKNVLLKGKRSSPHFLLFLLSRVLFLLRIKEMKTAKQKEKINNC